MKRIVANILVATVIIAVGMMLIFGDKGLTEDQIKETAITMNEKYNMFDNVTNKYNVEYTDFEYEEDDYYRYIVKLHFQYEDSSRNYHDNTVITYFRYDPDAEQVLYKPGQIAFPEMFSSLSEEFLMNSIKTDGDFGWNSEP